MTTNAQATTTNHKPEAAAPAISLGSAIVAKVGKKKRRRYSRGLKPLQRRIRGFAKLADTISDAIASGAGEFRKRSDSSARSKKDGALRYFWKDNAKGMKKALKKSAKIPDAIVDAVRPDRMVKVIRRFF